MKIKKQVINRNRSNRIGSSGDKIFNIINTFILITMGLICLLPFWYEICISLSSNEAVLKKEVFLWPVKFSTEAYTYVLNRAPFWRSLLITCERVFLGLPLSLFLMILAAYPLSKNKLKFKFRSIYVWYFFITMLFNGGMIPAYLVVVQMNLKNTIGALILPGCVNVFNMLLLLSFFRNVPEVLEDAARVDGASQWRILLKVYLPISLPVIATVTLFTVVANWNSWFDGMIYMKSDNYPLQTYLRTIIFNFDFENMTLSDQITLAQMSQKSVKAAQMVLGSIPILAIYPFLQKYFISGITLGSVKE